MRDQMRPVDGLAASLDASRAEPRRQRGESAQMRLNAAGPRPRTRTSGSPSPVATPATAGPWHGG